MKMQGLTQRKPGLGAGGAGGGWFEVGLSKGGRVKKGGTGAPEGSVATASPSVPNPA